MSKPKKQKTSNNKTSAQNKLAMKEYSKEEKLRIASFVKQYDKRPVKFKRTKTGPGKYTMEMQNPEDLLDAVKLWESLGTPGGELQSFFINQVTQTFKGCASSKGFNYEEVVKLQNNALAILQGIAPKDEIEGMLAIQMVGVHNLAMEAMGRAMIQDQTMEGRQANINYATKMLRTFTTQMEALNRYRGKGEQKVTVEHVHVNEGGKAIVGTINQERGGSKNEKLK